MNILPKNNTNAEKNSVVRGIYPYFIFFAKIYFYKCKYIYIYMCIAFRNIEYLLFFPCK